MMKIFETITDRTEIRERALNPITGAALPSELLEKAFALEIWKVQDGTKTVLEYFLVDVDDNLLESWHVVYADSGRIANACMPQTLSGFQTTTEEEEFILQTPAVRPAFMPAAGLLLLAA